MADETNEEDQEKTEFDADALTATQGLIGRLSGQLDELSTKQKELKNMLKNVFENDQQLAEAEVKAQDLNQEVKTRKLDLNQTQEVQDLKMKLSDITEDLKMVQESLNTHLLNYFQMTESTVVDMPDGTEREMDLKAKLKPPRKA
jgi:hypothetical protein